MVKIRLAANTDQKKWDDFVISQESSGPYHLFAWKESVEKAYHHRAHYLIAENDEGDIQGVLPLVLVKPPFIKGSLISQPFCDYGGVVSSDTVVSEKLLDYAMNHARELGSSLEIRCKEQNPVLDASPTLGSTSFKSRMLLALPESSDILWNSFKSKLRSQIRKPLKEGLQFKIGSSEKIDEFYTIFCKNMRSLGSPVHSRNWITSVIDVYDKEARIGVVYSNHKPIAAGIIICFRDIVSIPWASTLREYNSNSPNMLLYWGFLEYVSNNGFKIFDFGRSTPDEGTYKFKEQWGAKPSPLYWYIEGLKDQDQPVFSTGEGRKIAENAWSKLPLSVVNIAGPIIRKYIPL